MNTAPAAFGRSILGVSFCLGLPFLKASNGNRKKTITCIKRVLPPPNNMRHGQTQPEKKTKKKKLQGHRMAPAAVPGFFVSVSPAWRRWDSRCRGKTWRLDLASRSRRDQVASCPGRGRWVDFRELKGWRNLAGPQPSQPLVHLRIWREFRMNQP